MLSEGKGVSHTPQHEYVVLLAQDTGYVVFSKNTQ